MGAGGHGGGQGLQQIRTLLSGGFGGAPTESIMASPRHFLSFLIMQTGSTPPTTVSVPFSMSIDMSLIPIYTSSFRSVSFRFSFNIPRTRSSLCDSFARYARTLEFGDGLQYFLPPALVADVHFYHGFLQIIYMYTHVIVAETDLIDRADGFRNE